MLVVIVNLCLVLLPIALIISSSVVVLYYTDARATFILPTTVSIVGLSLVLLYAGLIPIDVFAAERVVHIGNFIRDLYYITVSCLMGFIFGAVPFAYFYTNAIELNQEHESDVTSSTSRSSSRNTGTLQLVAQACRHTALCLGLLVLLLLIAIVMHTVLTETSPTTYDTVGTMKKLFHSSATGHAVLNLTVGFLILLGTINLWIYTALGLAALPIVGCLKLGWTGVRDSCHPTSLEEDIAREQLEKNQEAHRVASQQEKERKNACDEIAKEREKTTKDRKYMYVKYGVTGRAKSGKSSHHGGMSKRAKQKSAQLEKKQSILSERLAKLEAESERIAREDSRTGSSSGGGGGSGGCCYCLWKLLVKHIIRGGYNCLKLPMGMISMVLSFVLWWSTTITVLNKFLDSNYEHGYVLHTLPSLFNPLDWLMRMLAFFFPLDIFVMGFIVLYILACTLYGMSHVGVRVCCLRTHTLQPRRTSAQGILFMVVNVVFVMLASTAQLMWVVRTNEWSSQYIRPYWKTCTHYW